MKTAVSVPDELFRQAETTARRFRVSRSALYSKALAEFLKRRDGNAITERLNDVYSQRQAKVDSALHRPNGNLSKRMVGNDGRDSARGDLVGRPPRAPPLRAWIQAPVPVVQADSFNLSRIQTAIVAAITTNVELAEAPGNVLVPARCHPGCSALSMKACARCCNCSGLGLSRRLAGSVGVRDGYYSSG